jgi:hypothetical protein
MGLTIHQSNLRLNTPRHLKYWALNYELPLGEAKKEVALKKFQTPVVMK